MIEQFISYHEALELKELGFNNDCLGWYLPEIVNKGNKASIILGSYSTNWSKFKDRISVPLYHQAFKFFRENYPNINFCLPLKKEKDLGIFWGGFIDNKSYGSNYKTYEEAELACLKKLIEIAKTPLKTYTVKKGYACFSKSTSAWGWLEDELKKEELSTKLHIGEVVDESYPESFRKQQETLEEAAKDYIENTMRFSFNSMETKTQANRMLKCVEFGAKWQQDSIIKSLKDNDYQDEPVFELLTEHFKKK